MLEDLEAARAFAHTFRYIDDILSISNPRFEQHATLVGGTPADLPIYPDTLSLNKTTICSSSVDYLGINIFNRHGTLLTKVANCTKQLPAPKINYPSLHGNFPQSSAYGVFIGQLHRFARICSSARDFITNAIQLYLTLLPKGYSSKRMQSIFNGFVRYLNPYKTRAPQLSRRFKMGIG